MTRRHRAPRRRAVSLVEVLIFVPIGLAVIAIAWTFFTGSAKSSKRTDAKAQGIQTNLLLALSLERDLESLYETPPPSFPFQITPEKTAIQFYRCASESPGSNWDPLPLEKITYRFDKKTGRVYRQVEDKTPEALHGYFEQVYFLVNTPRAAEGATDPLPMTSTVDFVAVAISTERFHADVDELKDPFLQTTLVGTIARRWDAGRFAYPFWNPIPYYPKVK